jgi:hypothetical protein
MGLPAGLRLCGEAVYFAHKPIHRASSVESWYTLTAQYATVVLITRSATCTNCVPSHLVVVTDIFGFPSAFKTCRL